MAGAVLSVLAVRAIVVDELSRARILAAGDLGELERCLQRAVTCSTVADLFSQ
jgi:hypothetical protein